MCGVSGGADSLALLVLAVAAGCAVTAVHVDHGLRPGSAAEAEVVAGAARRFGASFRSERVDLGDGPNLEARARRARREALGPGAATGHTMDDQAETVLANLLRGSGVHGLAGHAGRAPPPAARAATVRDGGPLRTPGPGPGGRPVQPAIPDTCATASATNCCPCARRCPGATSSRCWPDRPARWPATPTSSTPWPPWWTPRTPPPWPRRPRRWPAGACGPGCSARAPTRLRSTRWSGSSRWPASSARPPRSPGAGGWGRSRGRLSPPARPGRPASGTDGADTPVQSRRGHR